MPLRRRMLGRTGLYVFELGFGCAAFWARPVFPEREALPLLERAIERGIDFIDTGPNYAAGNAERRLGTVLRSLGSAAGKLVVCSKVGTHATHDGRNFRDWSPQAVRTSVRRSLERLGIDRLAVLHLHGPAPSDLTPPLLETLADLKREGMVNFLGMNTSERDAVRFGLANPLFDSFMIDYSIVRKRNGALLDAVTAAGAGAVISTPIAQALFRPSMWPTSLKKAWELARALKNRRGDLVAARSYGFLNELPGMTGAQAALAFAMRGGNFATAVFGTTSPQHLALNLAAADIVLPPDLVRRIEALPDA